MNSYCLLFSFPSTCYFAPHVGTLVRSTQQDWVTKALTPWLEDQTGRVQGTKKYQGDYKGEAQESNAIKLLMNLWAHL